MAGELAVKRRFAKIRLVCSASRLDHRSSPPGDDDDDYEDDYGDHLLPDEPQLEALSPPLYLLSSHSLARLPVFTLPIYIYAHNAVHHNGRGYGGREYCKDSRVEISSRCVLALKITKSSKYCQRLYGRKNKVLIEHSLCNKVKM